MTRRLLITHTTEYHYRQPVAFGVHRAMMRPREGHDLRIHAASVEVTPDYRVQWIRDIQGNSIALITLLGSSSLLRIHSQVEVHRFQDERAECEILALAEDYPFQYPLSDQVDILPYRLPSYPHDGDALGLWLARLYRPGPLVNTLQLLRKLNSAIFETFAYEHREEFGVQLPCETLVKGSGSCRDFAVFMMEAARHWGFAARFVTGYIQMEQGQHGATHAWAEIFLPGAGWKGFDPTNNKLAGAEHVAVGVAREQEKAAPLVGTWEGPAGAFERMEVLVKVEQL